MKTTDIEKVKADLESSEKWRMGYILRKHDAAKQVEIDLPEYLKLKQMCEIFGHTVELKLDEDVFILTLNKLESCQELLPFFEFLELDGWEYVSYSEDSWMKLKRYSYSKDGLHNINIHAYLTNCKLIPKKVEKQEPVEPAVEYDIICEAPEEKKIDTSFPDAAKQSKDDDIPF